MPFTVPGGQRESLPPRQEQRQPAIPQRNQSLQLWALVEGGSANRLAVPSRKPRKRRSHRRRVDGSVPDSAEGRGSMGVSGEVMRYQRPSLSSDGRAVALQTTVGDRVLGHAVWHARRFSCTSWAWLAPERCVPGWVCAALWQLLVLVAAVQWGTSVVVRGATHSASTTDWRTPWCGSMERTRLPSAPAKLGPATSRTRQGHGVEPLHPARKAGQPNSGAG